MSVFCAADVPHTLPMIAARLLVGIRTAARRIVSDRTVVAATFATIVLAATLLSAGPIYGEAITLSAFDRAMENAPPSESAISISARPFVGDFEAVDRMLNETVEETLAAAEAPATVIARASILELSAGGGAEPNLVEIWHVQGIEDLATLAGGRWPADGGPVELAIPVAVANELGVSVGDTVQLSPRSGDVAGSPVSVVGLFTFNDVTDKVWFSDPVVADGSTISAGSQTFGGLIASRSSVIGGLHTSRVRVTWRVVPDFATLSTRDLSSFTAGISNLEQALNGRVESTADIENADAVTFTLASTVQDRLGSIAQSLTVTSSTILAVILQLSLLAVYALILTSRLVVDTRAPETALARSRGASPVQVASTAVIEGLALAVPATLIAPPLAAWLIQALNRFGPLASIGLTIDPEPNPTAFVLAAVSAFVAVATLVWPAFRAARSFPGPEGRSRRQSGRSAAQKLGVDLVLVALLVIAVWQLEQLGPQVSATVRGRFGVDPLLVVAPVLGLAAGVVLAIRVVPRLARLSERLVSSRVPVIPALALWQVARRPNRYARSALLLMMAVALGVFASSFSASWIRSQQDQASHRVGADVRFTARTTHDAMSPLHMRPTLENTQGVTETLPITDIRGAVAAGRQARFVVTDAASLASVALIRPDLAGDLEGLADDLVEGRISLPALELPGEPVSLAMTWEALELPDPENPDDVVEPCPLGDPAGLLRCFTGSVSLVFTDGHDTLHRLDMGAVYAGQSPTRLEVDFLGPGGEAPEYPLSLAAIEFRTTTGRPTGPNVLTEPRSVIVSMNSAQVTDRSGATTPVAMVSSELSTQLVAESGTELVDRPTIGWEPGQGQGFAFNIYPGVGFHRVSGRIGTLIAAITPSAPPLARTFPVVATEALLEDEVWQVGMTVGLRPLDVGAATGRIIGTIPAFPGVDPTPSLVMLVDLPTYQALRYAPGEAIDQPEEYWLATNGGVNVGSVVAQAPFRGGGIVERNAVVSELTSDPIALGTVGAFAIGFVAAAVFAVIGFTISALVSARERMTEFSLLHAVGLDRRQLSGWLFLEQAVLALLSLGLGLAVGLAIAEFLLPLVTLNQDGSPATPELVVVHAWSTVWGLLFALLAVLALCIAVLIASVARRGVGSGLRFGDES